MGSAPLPLGLSERGNLEREGRRLGEAPPRRFVLSSACAAAGASCERLVGRSWLGGTSPSTSSSRSYQATSSSSERPPNSSGKAARRLCSWRRSSESSGREGADKYGGRLSSSRKDVRIASANFSTTRSIGRLLSLASPSRSSSTCAWTKRRGSGHAGVAFRTAAGLPMRGGRESISAVRFRQAACQLGGTTAPRRALQWSNFWLGSLPRTLAQVSECVGVGSAKYVAKLQSRVCGGGQFQRTSIDEVVNGRSGGI